MPREVLVIVDVDSCLDDMANLHNLTLDTPAREIIVPYVPCTETPNSQSAFTPSSSSLSPERMHRANPQFGQKRKATDSSHTDTCTQNIPRIKTSRAHPNINRQAHFSTAENQAERNTENMASIQVHSDTNIQAHLNTQKSANSDQTESHTYSSTTISQSHSDATNNPSDSTTTNNLSHSDMTTHQAESTGSLLCYCRLCPDFKCSTIQDLIVHSRSKHQQDVKICMSSTRNIQSHSGTTINQLHSGTTINQSHSSTTNDQSHSDATNSQLYPDSESDTTNTEAQTDATSRHTATNNPAHSFRKQQAHIDKTNSPANFKAASIKASSSASRTCPYCNLVLSHRAALFKHKRRKHQAELSAAHAKNTVNLLCHCQICPNFKCSAIQDLIGHYRSKHQQDMNICTKTFRDEGEFNQWKKETEKDTSSHFVKVSGSRKSKEWITSHYYCHRSGKVQFVTDRQRLPKTKGSSKIGCKCTAYMTARKSVEDATVTVDCCLQHTGHSFELCHQNLTDDLRTYIASKLADGLEPYEILDDVRNRITGVNRDSLVTKRDIYNIRQQYNISRSQKHQDDGYQDDGHQDDGQSVFSQENPATSDEVERLKAAALSKVRDIITLVNSTSDVDTLRAVLNQLWDAYSMGFKKNLFPSTTKKEPQRRCMSTKRKTQKQSKLKVKKPRHV